MEVNKEELINSYSSRNRQHRWHVSNETNSSASLRDTYVACGYVLWVVTRSSRLVFIDIARLVATGNDDLPSCFHAVHGLKLFTILHCRN